MFSRAKVVSLLCLLPLFVACSASDPATSAEDSMERDDAAVAAKQAAEAAAQTQTRTDHGPSQCDASQVFGLVGKTLDETAIEQARSDAKASRVRVLKPGQAVTLEFDGDRLNVETDAQGQVTDLRCG